MSHSSLASPSRVWDYVALMRLDKPIGIYLLLWPTLWALWLAARGLPDPKVLAIFVAGVVLMRSAGCVINDLADRNFDGEVARTRHRPLVTGRVSAGAAMVLLCVLCTLAFALVLLTNWLTIALSVAAAVLAGVYPFAKRYTHLPQVVLGAAFGWSIPMAFAAQSNALPAAGWLLFAANLCWTVAYDTQYAMVDREDDRRIGVKSTALLFGRFDRLIIAFLQLATLALLGWCGAAWGLSWPFQLALGVTALLFAHQQWLIRGRDRDACFAAFRQNHFAGAAVFTGIALALI